MQYILNLGNRQITFNIERKKVKNINLRIRKDGSIYVSAPVFVKDKVVTDFVSSKANFIIKAIEKAEKSLLSNENKYFLDDGNEVSILGKYYTISVVSSDNNTIHIDKDKLVFSICDINDYSVYLNLFTKLISNITKSTVTELCKEAYADFGDVLKKHPTIKFRKMKNKWGICRPTVNTLTFNSLLCVADVNCVKYVVYHEFCHFIHPNHSNKFYEELERRFPRAEFLKTELKKYGKYLCY